VIAGQVVTQSMFGDADTVPTLPDWMNRPGFIGGSVP
jgi:hypothetical protein